METTPLLACLLPARNAAADLPGWLAAIEPLADLVIALDDGSTDETAAILAAHPLVKKLIRHPRREDYAEWDDAANRNALLAAAAEFMPMWILSLDADERIVPDEAIRLRAFLQTDALSGCAYGFYHVPMRGDREHYAPRLQRVFRLFSWDPAHRFPDRKLHFMPIPESIPERMRVQTSFRIQHYGSFTSDRRQARSNKYAEADPHGEYLPEYGFLLDHPTVSQLRRWEPLDPTSPAIESALSDADLAELAELLGDDAGDPGVPALSAVVIARDETATIARTVASVVSQEVGEPFETIVVISGNPEAAEIVRETFPGVRLITIDHPVMPGNARNAGLAAAQGTYVVFVEATTELEPGNLAARLAAHRDGYGMVTGVVLNGTPTRAGWASYFLDHHELLPGLPAGRLDGPPPRCSYKAELLALTGGFPEDVRSAEDIQVNREASRRGYLGYFSPEVRDRHLSRASTAGRMLRRHFERGRGWSRVLLDEYRDTGHALTALVHAGWVTRHVPERIGHIRSRVRMADSALALELRRSMPLVVSGALAAWLGFWVATLRPRAGWRAVLIGRPVWTILLVTADGSNGALIRLDAVDRMVRLLRLPTGLRLPSGLDDSVAIETVLKEIAAGEADGQAWRERTVDAIGRLVDIDLDGWIVLGRSEPVPNDLDGLAAALKAGWSMLSEDDRRSIVRVCRSAEDMTVASDVPAELLEDAAEARSGFSVWARQRLGVRIIAPAAIIDDGSTWMP